MGHGTPDNMNWAGLLQNLLLLVHLRPPLVCGSVRFAVPEEQEPGTLAGSLSKHFPPPYQLLTQDYLWMDRSTGHFYTTEQKIDREALCPKETKAPVECIILHYAIVKPSGDLIQFPVIIEDVNDNAPRFENGEIRLRISEDVAVGTSFLLDDQAQDKDAGPNGEVSYHLEDSDGVFSLKVEDDGLFLMLVVRAALDRETQDRYRMALVATDRGAAPLSSTLTLLVTVTDVNDNCPSFGHDSPRRVSIPGGSPKDTLVARVRATDPDSGPNAAIVYSLSPKVSERAKELFSLDSLTGYITLTQDLRSDSSEELVLKVLAGGHQCPPADTQVTVSVLPKADRGLTIKIGFIVEHQNQTLVLPENQPPTVLAVLELEGDSSFRGASLAMEGEAPFTLSPQNGKYLLSTSKPLDYETRREHNITLVARVGSGEVSAAVASRRVIRVRVADVNDNAPHFLRPHYQLEVEENNRPGMSLLQVWASDADSGHNGRVTYRLDEHAPPVFSVDPVTGQLSLSASLDREQHAVHKLAVFARDSGSPALESEATVTIRVLDQNDNAPVFVTSHFVFFISENAPPSAQVGRVGVTDSDEGKNGSTELRLVNGSGPFAVDNTRGTLRTATNLDRETEDHYDLYLLAHDHGHPAALTSTARVTIFVEDINDNQPKVIFPSSNSSCLTVAPSASPGSTVTKIYALDEDSGLNSQITYTAAAPEPALNGSPFQVDSRSGNITLAQQLRPKHLGMHHLFIVVRDGGRPVPLFSTVWVNLWVNESAEPCRLDRAPTWTGSPDLVRTLSKAPMCETETPRSAQLTLLAGVGLILAFTCLCLVTVVLYLKQRRSVRGNVRGRSEENEIPFTAKDKHYPDD